MTNDWSETSNHKRFFDDFAAEHNFDPLVASNWYKQKRRAVVQKVRLELLSLAISRLRMQCYTKSPDLRNYNGAQVSTENKYAGCENDIADIACMQISLV